MFERWRFQTMSLMVVPLLVACQPSSEPEMAKRSSASPSSTPNLASFPAPLASSAADATREGFALRPVLGDESIPEGAECSAQQGGKARPGETILCGLTGQTVYRLGPAVATALDVLAVESFGDPDSPGLHITFRTGLLAEVTGALVDRHLAIIVEGQVVSAPRINQRITSDIGVFLGWETAKDVEAARIAILEEAGLG